MAQGCEEMQGFLFGQPMPAEQATRLLLPAKVVPFDPQRRLA